MIDLFVRLWRNDDQQLTEKPDLIIPISYGTLPTGLTLATEAILRTAIKYWRPGTLLMFGNADYLFKGAGRWEGLLKRKILREHSIPEEYILDAGVIKNTVSGALKIRQTLNDLGIDPKRILIVTGQMHSRSARYVWNMVFPRPKILVTCIHHNLECQLDHPVIVQRSPLLWFFANVARQILLHIFRLKLAKFHHVVSQPAKK